jgi:hypothetical protein
MDPEGFYKIPADGKVTDRHLAALYNIKVARMVRRKYAEDYYSGYADALAPIVAKKRREKKAKLDQVNGTTDPEDKE